MTLLDRRAQLSREWTDPTLRVNHLMALNTAGAAGLGFVFWVVVARLLPVDAVGAATATIAAVITVANIGQLNLYQSAGVLLARTPQHRRRRALGLWGLAVLATGVVAAAAALLGAATGWASSLAIPLWFAPLCAVVWSAFAVKDALLLALGRDIAVPLVTLGYGLAKIGVLLLLAAQGATSAPTMVVATFLPALALLPVAALLLFLRPARTAPGVALAPESSPRPVGRRADARFVAADHAGSIALQACTTLLPFVVFLAGGAQAAAVFAAAWTIVVTLDTLAHNAGVPLAAEIARSPERAGDLAPRLVRRTMILVVGGAVAIALLAHPLLTLFGPVYADAGTPVLWVLAAASVIRALLILRLALLRAARRAALVLAGEALHAAVVLGLAALLVPMWGAMGMALAWLAAQIVTLAVVHLLTRRKGASHGA
ncbi:hypothetical protein [Microbacterium invictum]|uniref:Polysaccharide biosynthesis protein n=1 Tax=Microbacterium invictum TaxID=515415 RepID=A0ABZ0VA31_9MICO|nr:hypothetical protein [Microbacterium invictum]WQB69738.1 hypothetical protein T9R20_13695 [Microbacterium invictum]